jgi:hypothetical protein
VRSADRRADVDDALVLDRHEGRAHTEDDAFDLVDELAASFADGDDDADLALRLGVEALLLQRREQPVAIGDARCLHADCARHAVSFPPVSDPKSTSFTGATNGLSAKRIRVGPDVCPDGRADARPMNTFWTVITVLVVVVLLAVALWSLVVAPFWVPRHSARR